MKRNRLVSVLMAGALLFSAALYARPDVQQRAASMRASAADYASDSLADYAYAVAAIVNRERAAYGLAPLKYSEQLSSAALVRAQEIQVSFSHTRPNGSSCFTAMTDAGISYRYAGENIAYGQRSPEAVMTGWMNSEGHRANILSSKVEYIGIGVTQWNGVYYWSQFFAASNVLTGTVISSDTPAQTTAPAVTTAPSTTATRRTTAAATTTVTTATTAVPVTTSVSADTTETAQMPAWTLPSVCGNVSADTLNNVLQKLGNLLGLDLSTWMRS